MKKSIQLMVLDDDSELYFETEEEEFYFDE